MECFKYILENLKVISIVVLGTLHWCHCYVTPFSHCFCQHECRWWFPYISFPSLIENYNRLNGNNFFFFFKDISRKHSKVFYAVYIHQHFLCRFCGVLYSLFGRIYLFWCFVHQIRARIMALERRKKQQQPDVTQFSFWYLIK